MVVISATTEQALLVLAGLYAGRQINRRKEFHNRLDLTGLPVYDDKEYYLKLHRAAISLCRQAAMALLPEEYGQNYPGLAGAKEINNYDRKAEWV